LFIYNVWLIPGISYLSRAQEEEALQKLNLMYQDQSASSKTTSQEDLDTPLKSVADILFTERMKMKFNEWRDMIISRPIVDSHLSENIKLSPGQFQTVFFKMRPATLLNGFSSHQLTLIQQVVLNSLAAMEYSDEIDWLLIICEGKVLFSEIWFSHPAVTDHYIPTFWLLSFQK
jgi:poly(A)-specific ribonuclease